MFNHKLLFYLTSVPMCPDGIIHIPCLLMPVAVYLPVPFPSNIMKPLLKCQYSPQYPMLAACHFIFTVKYSVILPLVNVPPGVTFSVSQYAHTRIHRQRDFLELFN